MKKFIKLITLSVATVLVLAIFAFSGCGLISGNLWTDVEYDNESAYTIGGGEISGSISEIVIDWPCDSVTVKQYNGTAVKVEETADKELEEGLKLRYLADNGKLTVQFATNGRHNIRGLNKELTVLVPVETTLNKLSIDSVSGNVTSQVFVNQFYAKSVSGSIWASNVILGASVNSVSGKITVAGGSVIQAGSVSGNIELALGNPTTVKATTVSGGIKLALAESIGFVLTFDTVSGGFSSDLETDKNGKTYTRLGGGAQITAKTTSGNLTIEACAEGV